MSEFRMPIVSGTFAGNADEPFTSKMKPPEGWASPGSGLVFGVGFARELNSWRTRHGVSSLCEFTLQPSLVYSASTPNTRPDPGEAWPFRRSGEAFVVTDV